MIGIRSSSGFIWSHGCALWTRCVRLRGVAQAIDAVLSDQELLRERLPHCPRLHRQRKKNILPADYNFADRSCHHDWGTALNLPRNLAGKIMGRLISNAAPRRFPPPWSI